LLVITFHQDVVYATAAVLQSIPCTKATTVISNGHLKPVHSDFSHLLPTWVKYIQP